MSTTSRDDRYNPQHPRHRELMLTAQQCACRQCRPAATATADHLTRLAPLAQHARDLGARLTGSRSPEPQPQPQPVREMRLVPVPHVPDSARWTPAEQALTARTLARQLAEHMSDYGAGVLFEALQMALADDMREAARAVRRPELDAAYFAASVSAGAAAQFLRQAEQAAT